MSKFNFEKWLHENTNWEDPDSQLIICETGKGGVSISSLDGEYKAFGMSLQEACEKFEEECEEDE